MEWNNTLVTLFISVFTELHEISCEIRTVCIAVESNYCAEPMCMKLFFSPFYGVQKSLLSGQRECCLSALFPINAESLLSSSHPPAVEVG